MKQTIRRTATRESPSARLSRPQSSQVVSSSSIDPGLACSAAVSAAGIATSSSSRADLSVLGHRIYTVRKPTGNLDRFGVSTQIVLLRGINIGPRNRVPMARLREALEEAGFAEVRTHLQSGNVVLESQAKISRLLKTSSSGSWSACSNFRLPAAGSGPARKLTW